MKSAAIKEWYDVIAKFLPAKFESLFNNDLMHVGGIDEGLGGVDPFADEKLMRLCGFGC